MKNNTQILQKSSEKLDRREKNEKSTVFSCDNTDKSLHVIKESDTYLDLTAKLVVKPKRISCGGRWITIKCGCDNGKIRPLKIGGCMNEDCIDCRESIKLRRTKKALPRLNAKRYSSPVMYTVFTVPYDVRKRAESTETWSYWRKCIVEVLKRDYGLRYALGSSHPTGEDENIFHPHLNFLWIQKTGCKHKIDLTKMRSTWSKIIKAKGAVDIYHQWYKKEYKIRHLVSYVLRTFPGWKFWRGQAVRWYGEYPRNIDNEIYEDTDWICPDCGEEITIMELIKDYARGNKRFEERFESGFT